MTSLERQEERQHSRNIGEVELAVGRMKLDVVQRVELAAKEVIQQDSDILWWFRIDEDDVRRPCAPSGIDEYQVAFIRPCSSIRHLHCLREIDLIYPNPTHNTITMETR